MSADTVIKFWFHELEPKQWWSKSDAFDQEIQRRFGALHSSAIAGECYGWRTTPIGRLAEIIVLDQFSRNIYRDKPQSFLADSQALVLAQEAILNGCDKEFSANERAFLYIPLMHSESLLVHEWAVQIYDKPDMESYLNFELRHKKIIERFGRYPHRNKILGRESTSEEIEFLQTPGSSF